MLRYHWPDRFYDYIVRLSDEAGALYVAWN
jgi:hypothetical protein